MLFVIYNAEMFDANWKCCFYVVFSFGHLLKRQNDHEVQVRKNRLEFGQNSKKKKEKKKRLIKPLLI